MKNSLSLYNHILSLAPPNSVIAGGCVRDLLLGKDPKDIDLWTSLASFQPYIINEYGVVHEKDWSLGTGPTVTEYDTSTIRSIVNYVYDGLDVQAMCLNTENIFKYIEDTFDLGTSMAMYDGSNLIVSPEFIDDVSNGIITLRNPNGVEQSLVRAQRVLEKYPTVFVNGIDTRITLTS